MSVLTWRHGTTKPAAITAVRAAVQEAGYAPHVTWTDGHAEARYGPFASVVHVLGEVTDDAVVLERCGGLAGGAVLQRCRALVEKLFPGGEAA